MGLQRVRHNWATCTFPTFPSLALWEYIQCCWLLGLLKVKQLYSNRNLKRKSRPPPAVRNLQPVPGNLHISTTGKRLEKSYFTSPEFSFLQGGPGCPSSSMIPSNRYCVCVLFSFPTCSMRGFFCCKTLNKFCYWIIVDLQCCVSFTCAAKGLSYTWIHCFLFFLFLWTLFPYRLLQSIE